MTKPLTEEQRRWHEVGTGSMKKNYTRLGKIAPRSCDPAVIGAAANSTGPSCLICGHPRGRTFGLRCEDCS